jgi:hypothetical protein
MNRHKERIDYLAQSYIAIAQRYRNWDLVKELIERNKDTEADVKKRNKRIIKKIMNLIHTKHQFYIHKRPRIC